MLREIVFQGKDADFSPPPFLASSLQVVRNDKTRLINGSEAGQHMKLIVKEYFVMLPGLASPFPPSICHPETPNCVRKREGRR